MHIRDTLRHYIWVIRQRVRFILLGVTFCAALTYVISLSIPPVYQASSLIKINGSITSTTNDVFSDQALAVGYALLVTSHEVLQEAAKRVPGTNANLLGRVVSDSPVGNTQIIEVRAQANTPQRATDIANAVAIAFIQVQVNEETQKLQSQIDDVLQMLTQTRMEADSAQQRFIALQNTHADEESIAQQKSMVDTYQLSYNTLLTRYNQLQTQKLQTTTMFTIAQVATVPDSATSPQVGLNVLLAASMSLILAILSALLFDWMDTTVKTADDVVQLAGLEPLGSIPLCTSARLAAHLLDFNIESTDVVRESFNMLGTSFLALNKQRQAILVTGLRTKVGTSTTAAHLAIALARRGIRVLLVDANLRRPLQHTIFQSYSARGLTNSLNDIYRLQDQSIRFPQSWLQQWKTPFPNLWLLPAGPSPTHPAVILRMPQLCMLKELLLGQSPQAPNRTPTRMVDIIIFDSASLMEGADTYELTTVADATVLVIEAGKEQKETLNNTRMQFQKLSAPILGVVINRQKAGQRTYFYANQPGPTAQEAVVPIAPSPDEQQRTVAHSYVPDTPVFPPFIDTAAKLPTYQNTDGLPETKTSPSKMQFRPLLQMREIHYHHTERDKKS